jgi:hypothetical protein
MDKGRHLREDRFAALSFFVWELALPHTEQRQIFYFSANLIDAACLHQDSAGLPCGICC